MTEPDLSSRPGSHARIEAPSGLVPAEPAPSIAWSVVHGYAGPAFGVRQPSVAVRLSFRSALAAAAEQVLADRFEPTMPRPAAGPPGSEAAAAVVYWTAVVQEAAGLAVFEPGRVLRPDPGQDAREAWTVLVACQPGRVEAARLALEGIARWLGGAPGSAVERPSTALDALLERLRASAPRGQNTIHLLRAAHASGIPWDWVAGNCWQYGWGSRSRRMDSSYTDRTPVIGATLARNKHHGASVLRRAGLPVPAHAVAKTADEAVRVAQALGYPVVVKPASLDGGTGVAAGLRSDEAVRRAFTKAVGLAGQVLVEKHFEGRDYRLLVFDGQLVWTVLRQPAGVIGDGRATVAELVDRANTQVRQMRHTSLAMIHLDEEATELLGEQRMTTGSVPPAGAFVRLNRAANVARGGRSFAVNEDVHPDNRRLAEQAAEALGLDIAGIDLLIPDIARSWRESGAAICEVNGQPQFGTHTQQHLHGQVLRALVTAEGRIPALVVLGHDESDLVQAIATRLGEHGLRVGLASDAGAFIGGEALGRPVGVFDATRALLSNPRTDALIVHVRDDAVVSSGLPLDRIDVLVLASELAGRAGALASTCAMLRPHVERGWVYEEGCPECSALSRRIGGSIAVPRTDPPPIGPANGALARVAIDCLQLPHAGPAGAADTR